MPGHSEPKVMAPPAPPKQFFTEILWNFLYRIKRDAPPAPPRIPQKFHNFLDFYTAPPKFTHAPPKFTHFRSMSSGDILILVKWNLKFEILWFRISSFIWMSHILFSCAEFYTSCISLSGWSAPLPLWHKHPVTTRWWGQPGHGKPTGAVKLTDRRS